MFIDLFVKLNVSHFGLVNEEIIELYLKNKNLSCIYIEQWRKFYNKLLQASFAKENQLDKKALFQESFVWLQRLKEIV